MGFQCPYQVIHTIFQEVNMYYQVVELWSDRVVYEYLDADEAERLAEEAERLSGVPHTWGLMPEYDNIVMYG